MRLKKISPVLTGLVHTALRSCEGIRFHPGTTCPSCGGTLSGYDERRKRFAVLLEEDLPGPVHVIIQRSYCHDCGKITEPEEPFYPATRIGSPVVDLCRSLSMTMPCSRASAFLGKMGVLVDRWSVRHYTRMSLPEVPVMEVFGMQIPASIIALSTLPRRGSEPVDPDMDDVLRACNYPFVPFGTPSTRNGDAAATFGLEKQKIIDGFVNGFSRSLGIVFVCLCILASLFSGIASDFPAVLIDLTGLDMEILSIPALGGL